jgi:hypothetical protein
MLEELVSARVDEDWQPLGTVWEIKLTNRGSCGSQVIHETFQVKGIQSDERDQRLKKCLGAARLSFHQTGQALWNCYLYFYLFLHFSSPSAASSVSEK